MSQETSLRIALRKGLVVAYPSKATRSTYGKNRHVKKSTLGVPRCTHISKYTGDKCRNYALEAGTLCYRHSKLVVEEVEQVQG